MHFKVTDLEDPNRFRKLLDIRYPDLVDFILENIRPVAFVSILFWSCCAVFLLIAVIVRINIAGNFLFYKIFLHSLLGFIVFPVLIIPLHELMHIIPYFLSGARNIRVGMDLRQLMFYVTAHRYVAGSSQFKVVALIPFLLISLILLYLIFTLPGLWKWSLSLFLFMHATMCAGDFALLNYYWINRRKKIYTWDDADQKIAYFYEEIASVHPDETDENSSSIEH